MKILKNITKNRIYTYEDFSIEVKNFLFKKALLLPIFMIVSFFIGLFLKGNVDIYSVIAIWCIPLVYLGYIYYNYYIFAYKKFIVITGVVNEVVKNRTSITKNIQFYGKNYMTLQSDGTNFEININYADDYKVGNVIKIYARDNGLSMYSNETFIVDPILICFVKNMETSSVEEDLKEENTPSDIDVKTLQKESHPTDNAENDTQNQNNINIIYLGTTKDIDTEILSTADSAENPKNIPKEG